MFILCLTQSHTFCSFFLLFSYFLCLILIAVTQSDSLIEEYFCTCHKGEKGTFILPSRSLCIFHYLRISILSFSFSISLSSSSFSSLFHSHSQSTLPCILCSFLLHLNKGLFFFVDVECYK